MGDGQCSTVAGVGLGAAFACEPDREHHNATSNKPVDEMPSRCIYLAKTRSWEERLLPCNESFSEAGKRRTLRRTMSPITPQLTAASGERLSAALTTEQTTTLLGVIADAGLLARLDARLRAADPDLADTIRRLLDTKTSAQAELTLSGQKTLETWSGLWGEWQDHVSELGDEKGNYVNHEEHWHPPYFDSSALEEDLEVWLECCEKHTAFFGKHWRSLALLTRSLPQDERTKTQAPTFHTHVLMPALSLSADLDKSVREALGFLGDAATRLDPMSIWKEHLHRLVPSPGATGGLYRDPALWMKALSEVNRGSYDKLLAQWKTEFRRRRNLWADMAATSCPGL